MMPLHAKDYKKKSVLTKHYFYYLLRLYLLSYSVFFGFHSVLSENYCVLSELIDIYKTSSKSTHQNEQIKTAMSA